MKSLILTLAALLWLLPMQVDAQSRTGPPIRLRAAVAQQPIAAADTAAPRGPILRILERRRMGLTFRNVVRVLQEMKADGRLTEYSYVDDDGRTIVDVSSLAVGVAGQLSDEKPGDWSDIDWDAVLAFLEKLIELILKFLPLFL